MRTEKVTIHTLRQKKAAGDKITMLTCYDATFARLLDDGGVDILLVGDSLGMVVQGNATTLPVTLDEMIYHTRAVVRGARRAQIVGDMPFMSYQTSPEDALRAAGQLMKQGGAEAIKLEGGAQHAELIRRLVVSGIPVMGHIGLTPQSYYQLGGFKVQGRDATSAERLLEDARVLEEAGAYAIVLEGIPLEVAARITAEVSVPTIGIGAGPHCDGQVLVIYDLLGMNEEFKPKFVKRYENFAVRIRTAVDEFIDEVKNGRFPSEDESFSLAPVKQKKPATVSAIALAGGCSPTPGSDGPGDDAGDSSAKPKKD